MKIKLLDVPELKYTSEDKDENGNDLVRGEICFKGPTVMKG